MRKNNAERNTDMEKNALRLQEVNRLAVKATIEGALVDLFTLLDEFKNLKKSIKIFLIDTAVPKVDNKKAQMIFKQIVSEHVFEADKMIVNIENITGTDLNVDQLTPDETEQLESDLFYSWFSGYEYVNALYEIGSLILTISVPKILEDFVREARSCFAFQQYNALYSLCRTIIEVAIRDICTRKGFIKAKDDNVIIFEQYQKDNISQLINKITRGRLRFKIKDIYYGKTSFLIHGHKTATRIEAKSIFRETMTSIQELYLINGY